MNIQDQFAVEIIRVNPFDGSAEDVVAQSLSEGIVHWERELYEEDEEEEDDNDFLVSDATDEEDDVTSEDEEEEDNEGADCEVSAPTGLLTVQTTINKGVLEDIRALQNSESDDELLIKFTYGDAESGTFTRQFKVSADVSIILSEGARRLKGDPTDDLLITLSFDLFDSDFVF